MKIPSDSTLLEMIEQHKLHIDAPFVFGKNKYSTWHIRSNNEDLLGSSENLRVALLKAYAKLNKEDNNA